MRIMVLGADGYLGWPTCMHLSARGHDVFAIDNFAKRRWETDHKASPLYASPFLADRIDAWRRHTDKLIEFSMWDVRSAAVRSTIDIWKPDAIIHYAEQPSAPYSMGNPAQCMETYANNTIGTLNILWAIKDMDVHLVKLGTMAEIKLGIAFWAFCGLVVVNIWAATAIDRHCLWQRLEVKG